MASNNTKLVTADKNHNFELTTGPKAAAYGIDPRHDTIVVKSKRNSTHLRLLRDETKTKTPTPILLSDEKLECLREFLVTIRAAINDDSAWSHVSVAERSAHQSNCELNAAAIQAALRQHNTALRERAVAGAEDESIDRLFETLTLSEGESDEQLNNLFAKLALQATMGSTDESQ
jgi:hypothetical protein